MSLDGNIKKKKMCEKEKRGKDLLRFFRLWCHDTFEDTDQLP